LSSALLPLFPSQTYYTSPFTVVSDLTLLFVRQDFAKIVRLTTSKIPKQTNQQINMVADKLTDKQTDK